MGTGGRLRDQGFARVSAFHGSEEDMADVDQVVGDNSKPNKPPHSVRSSVAAATDPVTPFENADAAFTAGAPFLKLFKPTLLLTLLACGTLGVMTRNRYPAHPHLLGLGFISG